MVRDIRHHDQPRIPPLSMSFRGGCLALTALMFGAQATQAQTRLYYDQTYLRASHNWAFRSAYPGTDRLFNAFDYVHSILYETLWRNPDAPQSTLDRQQFDFITTKLLVHPPRFALD